MLLGGRQQHPTWDRVRWAGLLTSLADFSRVYDEWTWPTSIGEVDWVTGGESTSGETPELVEIAAAISTALSTTAAQQSTLAARGVKGGSIFAKTLR